MQELFKLEGRNAVVVGAGAGIGRAVANGLAAHGAFVGCVDLDGHAAQVTAEELGSQTDTGAWTADVRDAETVAEVFGQVAGDRGTLDVVVCTPGINVRKPLLDYQREEFELVVDVNLRGTLNVLQGAGRIMREQGSGSIIVFSSIRSLVVEPGQGVYAATKAGIVQMVRAAAAELGPHGVRVNAVAPGVIDTPLTAPIKDRPEWYEAYGARNAFGRWGRAEEMAGPAVFLASDASSYVTGSVLFADAGWTAIDGRFTPPGM